MQLHSLLPLLLCALTVLGEADPKRYVDMVLSVDQFYDQVNSVDSYTMVEYTTTWCHHCKTLKPAFEELMISYDDDESKLPVKFLEVSCEVFASQICKELRAFPHIRLIVPRDEPLVVPQFDYSSMFFHKRWWTRLMNYVQSPGWQLDKKRVFDYKGDRDAQSMRNFIETIRANDGQRRFAHRILQHDRTCEGEEDVQLCEEGKRYVANLNQSQLDHELSKLEKLIESNSEEKLDSVKLKLELVNQLISVREKEEKIRQKKKKQEEAASAHDEF